MALTKTELIASLQDEVRILLHLAGKIEPGMYDYRPTPKQRSTLELLRYLSMMGPEVVDAAKTGTFDHQAWTAAEAAAAGRDFEQTLAVIAAQGDRYAAQISPLTEADFGVEVAPFGQASSRGACIVTNVLSGHAAYRMQLFCYLKACGRTDLNTMNLWAGMDATKAQA
jgi:hypothetical protein